MEKPGLVRQASPMHLIIQASQPISPLEYQRPPPLTTHLQPLIRDLSVSQSLVALCLLRVLHWVTGVHAINLGGLQEHLSLDLSSPQGGCRVCGEEGVASACSNNSISNTTHQVD